MSDSPPRPDSTHVNYVRRDNGFWYGSIFANGLGYTVDAGAAAEPDEARAISELYSLIPRAVCPPWLHRQRWTNHKVYLLEQLAAVFREIPLSSTEEVALDALLDPHGTLLPRFVPKWIDGKPDVSVDTTTGREYRHCACGWGSPIVAEDQPLHDRCTNVEQHLLWLRREKERRGLR